MLSPTVDKATPAQSIAIEKGKIRSTSEKSITSELLILMQEMRDKMRGRDEKLMEELRWRGNNQDVENKKRII